MGVPKNGWFMREKTHLNGWLRGIPISGNPQIRMNKIICSMTMCVCVFMCTRIMHVCWIYKPDVWWKHNKCILAVKPMQYYAMDVKPIRYHVSWDSHPLTSYCILIFAILHKVSHDKYLQHICHRKNMTETTWILISSSNDWNNMTQPGHQVLTCINIPLFFIGRKTHQPIRMHLMNSQQIMQEMRRKPDRLKLAKTSPTYHFSENDNQPLLE